MGICKDLLDIVLLNCFSNKKHLKFNNLPCKTHRVGLVDIFLLLVTLNIIIVR